MSKPTTITNSRKFKARLKSAGKGKPIDLSQPEPPDNDIWATILDDDDPPVAKQPAKKKAHTGEKRKPKKFRIGFKPKETEDVCPRTDIDFGDNLWKCIDAEDAGGWLARQQALFNEKAIRGYHRKRLDNVIRVQADALLFEPGSIDGASIVDDGLTMAAFERLHRQMTDYLVRNPDDDLLFVTIITGDVGTSLDRPEIRLKQIKQQANSILRKLGPNHFGMLDISCFSNIRHENGGRHIQPHVHALVFGPGIAGKTWRVTGKASRILTQNVTEIDPLRVINVTDKGPPNLARLSAYLVKPPAKCKNWYRRDDGKAIMNHSDASQRFIRYTRMAQVRSLLSFEDVALAGGDGVAIRGSLVTDLRGLAKAAGRAGKPMHPDELPRFWSDFNRAIGKDRFAVPVILRK